MQVLAKMQLYLLFLQVRSAFSMAFTTLTDPKIILSLGPNRSILGTIIRPDPVLMERKGGSNGEMTFNSLLPGAGEPLQQQYGEKDMLCNWQLDYDEEPLPRGNGTSAEPKSLSNRKRKSSRKEKKASKKLTENGDSQMVADVHDTSAEPSMRSSRKKRKSASKENSSKKLKENGGSQMVENVENGSRTENGTSKKKKKKQVISEASC